LLTHCCIDNEINQLKGTLSVREAMHVLEHWIAVDILGSKKSVKELRLYTIQTLINKGYSYKVYNICDECHCSILTFLKKLGDTTAHTAASKDAIVKAIGNLEEDDNKELALELVDMLAWYCTTANLPFGWDPLASNSQNKKHLYGHS